MLFKLSKLLNIKPKRSFIHHTYKICLQQTLFKVSKYAIMSFFIT